MWFLKKLLLAAAIAFWLFQNPTSGKESKSSASSAESAPSIERENTVTPAQPVITAHDVCEEGPGKNSTDANACARVMTRVQFENLMNALNPAGQAISAKGRQNLAKIYAESLALEAAARSSGMEDSDEFRELMAWTRLRAVADLYRRKLEEKYRSPSPEEVDAYYRQHVASYERVKLSRVLIPRQSGTSGDNNEFDRKALEAANNARVRVATGEDPELVQKDVYSALGLSTPPPTGLGKYVHANFTDKEEPDVFALKAGEASPVEIEPKNYVIYEVEAKETLPEEEVKTEISHEISQQKFKDAIAAITDAAHFEFDEQYFGGRMNMPLKVPSMPATPPKK
jgi:hypothetical protein